MQSMAKTQFVDTRLLGGAAAKLRPTSSTRSHKPHTSLVCWMARYRTLIACKGFHTINLPTGGVAHISTKAQPPCWTNHSLHSVRIDLMHMQT